MRLTLCDSVQIPMEKGNKMIIKFYGSISLAYFKNKRNMVRKIIDFKECILA